MESKAPSGDLEVIKLAIGMALRASSTELYGFVMVLYRAGCYKGSKCLIKASDERREGIERFELDHVPLGFGVI